MKKISKSEAKKIIDAFFEKISEKNSKEIKKIKRIAMGHNLLLREKRKLFCKKCLAPYGDAKTRIRNEIKSIICKNCGYATRWKIK